MLTPLATHHWELIYTRYPGLFFILTWAMLFWIRMPPKVMGIELFVPIGGTIWGKLGRFGLAEESMSLEAGFENSQPWPTSGSKSLLHTCDLKCDLWASGFWYYCNVLPCLHFAMVDSYPSRSHKTKWSLFEVAFGHGTLSQQQEISNPQVDNQSLTIP